MTTLEDIERVTGARVQRLSREATGLRALALLCCAVVLLALLTAAGQAQAAETPELPRSLRETGLYDNPRVLAFAPQYALWSDGADKQRWIALPAGTSIDASNPDAWVFPVGTRLWKTFSHGGRAVETRYSERLADGRWRFATYVWRADGHDADLAPERGIAALPVAAAPGGRYALPSRGDCMACHGGAASPVLGFSALQLAGELRTLAARGLVSGLPATLIERPPRVAAASDVERMALGYLHGNCAHCHHAGQGRVPVRLNLQQRVADAPASAADVLASMTDAPSRYGEPGERVLVPGDAAASVLARRMRSRDPRVQMPPLGTAHPDTPALALIERWIQHDLPQRKDP